MPRRVHLADFLSYPSLAPPSHARSEACGVERACWSISRPSPGAQASACTGVSPRPAPRPPHTPAFSPLSLHSRI
eukprot:scaffold190611_cov30-Tisochrysis_lutea.AAC.2